MTPSAENDALRVAVRVATPADAGNLVAGIVDLLRELSARPDREAPEGAVAAALHLIGDPRAGLVLVAEDTGKRLVGLVTASYQTAIRTGGPYAQIQELYVRPEARSSHVGEMLVTRLVETASTGVFEVGLPGERFDKADRTREFYLHRGFSPIGPRMRYVAPEGRK
ncbi:GNAT family N-acetyltransferase [Amycolatopsis sp. NBC_00345]|uniref:GNAT family N-acetyltransferase n=1 Tax=Amycolatopsis sp. NBC_00345 TaxID=2975955 RepID=UPI002E268D67